MKLSDLALPDAARRDFAHLLDQLGDDPLPEPAGWRLMALQYVRPAKSAGGVIFAESTKREDEWQGRVGLVLAVGAACWRDPARYPEGPWARVGDVILWPKLDNMSTRQTLNGCTLAFINDDAVVGLHIQPLKAMA